MQAFYSLLLKLLGWTSRLPVDIPPQCVICVAPHTSNWDFIIGIVFYKSINGHPHFLMKKSWFFFPLHYLLRAIGGIPINRSNRESVTNQMTKEFQTRNHFQLAITPEGTRKKNAQWKTGFYYIAYEAKVPITLAYLDYSKKEIGVFENFIPTGNAEEDIQYIKQLYVNVQAKYPEKFAINRHE